MLTIAVLSILLAIAAGAPHNKVQDNVLLFKSSDYSSEINGLWSTFKTEHAKEYINSAEEMERKRIFTENLQEIESHNFLYSKGLKSYTMAVNQFSDMTLAEILAQKTGLIVPSEKELKSGSTYFSPAFNFTLPDSVDWRQKGYVTPVKNQLNCGSCWSFSTTGVLEGQQFRKTGKLVSLSEQNLIDCSSKYGNHGCHGGNMVQAYKYIHDNGGIDSEESYPYKAKEGECHYSEENRAATVSSFVVLPSDDEQKLTEAIATVGPIAVGIVVHSKFFKYHSGLFDEPHCGQDLGHAVLAVGYGSENGKDFYIVKNTWGTSWGEGGYVRMARNKDNQCRISSFGSYPLV